jgi:leucyl aminopeptidase
VAIEIPEPVAAHKSFAGTPSNLREIGRVTAETIAMVLYRPNHYKTEAGGFKAEPRISAVKVSCGSLCDADSAELKRGLDEGAYIAASVNLARDTANEPANKMTPSILAELARKVASESGGTITCEVLEDFQCEALGMNAFLAVSKGSAERPKLIVLDYAPVNCKAGGPVLGYVGKSVTFDSGGLDIKPADGMRDMKYDMCGGADVIAAMRAIAHLGLPIRVKAFMAATENMTGPKAYRPGDVYVGLDGKSYEIDNTDAEGRLTLVDAIAYARKHGGVTHIVDYATLTGAVLVTLGDIAAGVFTNNQDWADKYLAAAKAQDERVFQMPLFDEFKELNKSKIADLKNSGGRFGGSSTAALFVLSAAGDTPTVHVDIAGVAFRSRETGMDPAGGTGFGVRTLVQLASDLAKSA